MLTYETRNKLINLADRKGLDREAFALFLPGYEKAFREWYREENREKPAKMTERERKRLKINADNSKWGKIRRFYYEHYERKVWSVVIALVLFNLLFGWLIDYSFYVLVGFIVLWNIIFFSKDKVLAWGLIFGTIFTLLLLGFWASSIFYWIAGAILAASPFLKKHLVRDK